MQYQFDHCKLVPGVKNPTHDATDNMIVGFEECSQHVKETACRTVYDMWHDDLRADGISSWEICMDVFANFSNENIGSVWVYVIEHQFVGIIAAHVDNRHNVQLCYFLVIPEYRGSGFGTALLNHALTAMQNKTVLIACDDNTVDFYEKRGFVIYDPSAQLTSGRKINAMVYKGVSKII